MPGLPTPLPSAFSTAAAAGPKADPAAPPAAPAAGPPPGPETGALRHSACRRSAYQTARPRGTVHSAGLRVEWELHVLRGRHAAGLVLCWSGPAQARRHSRVGLPPCPSIADQMRVQAIAIEDEQQRPAIAHAQKFHPPTPTGGRRHWCGLGEPGWWRMQTCFQLLRHWQSAA